MIIAGIDPSLTNTGIAILHNGTPLDLHSIGFGGRDGATYNERSDRIVAQTRAVTEQTIHAATTRPDLAIIEGPAYGHNLPSAHDRAGLWWGIYSALRAKHIPTTVIAPGTRAKWTTGHGRATKTEILTTVRTWWPNTRITNHDIADALALATIGAAWAGDPLPFPLKDRHRNTIEQIPWPVTT